MRMMLGMADVKAIEGTTTPTPASGMTPEMENFMLFAEAGSQFLLIPKMLS